MSPIPPLVDKNIVNNLVPLLKLDTRKLGMMPNFEEREKMIFRAIYKQIREKENDKQVALEILRTLLHLKPQELLHTLADDTLFTQQIRQVRTQCRAQILRRADSNSAQGQEVNQVKNNGEQWTGVNLHGTAEYDAGDDWEIIEMAEDLPSAPHGDSAPGSRCVLM